MILFNARRCTSKLKSSPLRPRDPSRKPPFIRPPSFPGAEKVAEQSGQSQTRKQQYRLHRNRNHAGYPKARNRFVGAGSCIHGAGRQRRRENLYGLVTLLRILPSVPWHRRSRKRDRTRPYQALKSLNERQFETIVSCGLKGNLGTGVMPAWKDNPNIFPYIENLWAYLSARANGALGPGRPQKLSTSK